MKHQKGLEIFELLSGLDDDMITAATLPESAILTASPRPAREQGFWGHFFENGWVVAGISAIVAVAVLAGIIAAGQNAPKTDEGNRDPFPPPDTGTVEESISDETVSDEAEPEKTYVYSEGLEYKDYGDVYAVSGIGTCADEVVVIPPTYNGRHVFGIEEAAFLGGTMRKVVIPGTMLRIGDAAFAKCANLTEAIVGYTEDGSPSRELELGKNIFSGCTALTNVVLAEGITMVSEYMFNGCESLVQINLPSTLRSIERCGFSQCFSLANITIPDGVTKIGAHAFSYCYSLTSVYVPASVKQSGDANSSAFDHSNENLHIYYAGGLWTDGLNNDWKYHVHCEGLKPVPDTELDAPLTYSEGLKFAENGDGTYSVKGLGACKDRVVVIPPEFNGGAVTCIASRAFSVNTIQRVVIPDSVTTIEPWAFNGCSMTEVDIPQSVTSIGDCAFQTCYALKRVTIPGCVTEIGRQAFRGCGSLTELVVESGVTSLGDETFWECSALTSVTLPDTLREIGKWVFANCSSLEEITLPEGLVTIGKVAFGGCTSLTGLVIPHGVTRLERSIITECESLTYIVIPHSVTYMDSPFGEFSGLRDVYFTGTEEQWNAIEGSHELNTPLFLNNFDQSR